MGDTTISLKTDTRDELNRFRDAIPDVEVQDGAVRELLRIAADEGYYDGEGGAELATISRVEELEERQHELEEQNEKLYRMLKKLREQK